MLHRLFGLFALLICLVGCDASKHLQHHDPTLQMPKNDYEQRLTGQGDFKKQPKPQPLIATPKKPQIPAVLKRLITLSVTDQIPMKEVFMEMARQAKVTLALDPSINGGIYYQAHKKPFMEVLDDICAMAKLRYSLKGSSVHVQQDTPYHKTYNVQFLSLSRENTNRISTATDVFTAMEGYSRDFDNGSSTILTEKSSVNFWEELDANLANLMENTGDDQAHTYSIHKQAGLISIFGTHHQHKKVQLFLDQIVEATQRQVLIEAKIVEVNLNEEFKTGINWNRLKKDFTIQGSFGGIAKPGAFDAAITPDNNVFTLGTGKESLTALASILNRFGTVRTLSSPRMTVMNNQSAVLKVATNFVFFKINYSREIRENEQNDLERASSQIQTVPIGLVMVVHPTIDKESGRVTLTLRPTISRVVREKEDPAVSILSQNARTSKIPEVQVRELNSVLNVENGGVVVMGGLMEERSDNERNGVPGVGDIPILGDLLASAKDDSKQVSELVIFLRATIQDTVPTIFKADEELYATFVHDPRPLF
ncbi:MAG: type II secretion system protein GspD [Alphaproteobacteria bacterium]